MDPPPPPYYGFGFKGDAGPYLVQTRNECVHLVQPKTADELKFNVTGCILSRFNELDKALFSSRQYILTLWPAFVGAIVALAPDPSRMVYDNIWWSGLFAITSGGLPGLESESPPHHVEAHSEEEGRTMCETWKFNPSMPKAMSKTDTMGSSTQGEGYIYLEWLSFFLSFVLWLSFCIYFAHTLKPALDITFETYYLEGAVWYYISASPAIGGLIFGLMRNRVDLYEPADRPEEGEQEPLGTGGKGQTISPTHQQCFKHVKVRSVFSLWLRILRHQWGRSQYRILVRDHQSPRTEWFFVFGRGAVGMGRVAVFAVGSIAMGNILLMPVPDDLYLFVLLLFTTSVPRQLWSAIWTNGNRGADLVVWVSTVKVIRPDGAH
ncbi:hypothetical protein MMC28_008146 [Mycoblastus sanguinarius]|nr:hypothetical protein [Mycoblastus sanguinarius]